MNRLCNITKVYKVYRNQSFFMLTVITFTALYAPNSSFIKVYINAQFTDHYIHVQNFLSAATFSYPQYIHAHIRNSWNLIFSCYAILIVTTYCSWMLFINMYRWHLVWLLLLNYRGASTLHARESQEVNGWWRSQKKGGGRGGGGLVDPGSEAGNGADSFRYLQIFRVKTLVNINVKNDDLKKKKSNY
jgi:hypothetical protein